MKQFYRVILFICAFPGVILAMEPDAEVAGFTAEENLMQSASTSALRRVSVGGSPSPSHDGRLSRSASIGRLESPYLFAEEEDAQLPKKCLEGLKVLLIDDQLINLKVGKRALTSAGAVVVDTADSGEAALAQLGIGEIAEDQAGASTSTGQGSVEKKYDLMLMDMKMPVLNGCQTSAQIRASDSINKNTPIILFTSEKIDGDLWDEMQEAGIQRYCKKPCKFKAVLYPKILALTGRSGTPEQS